MGKGANGRRQMTTRREGTKFGGEPRLSELLDDPILDALLRRDRLSRVDLLASIAAARARLDAIRAR
jgi:hypothetical protein